MVVRLRCSQPMSRWLETDIRAWTDDTSLKGKSSYGKEVTCYTIFAWRWLGSVQATEVTLEALFIAWGWLLASFGADRLL
jgi:hypothetical protein